MQSGKVRCNCLMLMGKGAIWPHFLLGLESFLIVLPHFTVFNTFYVIDLIQV
jgi:hypothetical protein